MGSFRDRVQDGPLVSAGPEADQLIQEGTDSGRHTQQIDMQPNGERRGGHLQSVTREKPTRPTTVIASGSLSQPADVAAC